MGARLMGDALQLKRFVCVMVFKGPAECDLQAEGFECAPKILRIAKPAKSGDATRGQILEAGAGPVIAPVTGDQAGTEGRRGGVVLAEAGADGAVAKVVFGASDHKDLRAAESLQGLA
jgi:hypothetical protein